MNKTQRVFLIWALLVSPILLGAVIVRIHPDRQGDPMMLLGQVAGVAAIGVVGLVTSILMRKIKNADKLSIIGYAVPAILVCGYQLFR